MKKILSLAAASALGAMSIAPAFADGQPLPQGTPLSSLFLQSLPLLMLTWLSLFFFFRGFMVRYDLEMALDRMYWRLEETEQNYLAKIQAHWSVKDTIPEPAKSDFVDAVRVFAQYAVCIRGMERRLDEMGSRMFLGAPMIIALLLSMVFITTLGVDLLAVKVIAGAAMLLANGIAIAHGVRTIHQMRRQPLVLDETLLNDGAEREVFASLIERETTTADALVHSFPLSTTNVHNAVRNALSALPPIP